MREDPVTMAAIQVRTNLTSENRLPHIQIVWELAESRNNKISTIKGISFGPNDVLTNESGGN